MRRAPSAFSTPISRVRCVTETSMMFIRPMPPMPERDRSDERQQNLQAHGDDVELRELLLRVEDEDGAHGRRA